MNIYFKIPITILFLHHILISMSVVVLSLLPHFFDLFLRHLFFLQRTYSRRNGSTKLAMQKLARALGMLWTVRHCNKKTKLNNAIFESHLQRSIIHVQRKENSQNQRHSRNSKLPSQYSLLKGKLPKSFDNFFQTSSDIHSNITRFSKSECLYMPRFKSVKYGLKSITNICVD